MSVPRHRGTASYGGGVVGIGGGPLPFQAAGAAEAALAGAGYEGGATPVIPAHSFRPSSASVLHHPALSLALQGGLEGGMAGGRAGVETEEEEEEEEEEGPAVVEQGPEVGAWLEQLRLGTWRLVGKVRSGPLTSVSAHRQAVSCCMANWSEHKPCHPKHKSWLGRTTRHGQVANGHYLVEPTCGGVARRQQAVHGVGWHEHWLVGALAFVRCLGGCGGGAM